MEQIPCSDISGNPKRSLRLKGETAEGKKWKRGGGNQRWSLNKKGKKVLQEEEYSRRRESKKKREERREKDRREELYNINSI